ncbi:putative lipoprotein YbbD precursor [Pirellulimonas nuda]|uniref:beta-N-acetylhexosaminidase n=1 Tax=Pirellulimonas nuda TaxID=2528009 RepID=A0A518DAL8_9BACT|nr:glycoside hydrolase family 3 N-terminal domain-containing protein [Pirellulimonas nuda]QDU88512.1 putative lipoprotein YbbD precursor [Pirellulimonas nuda]
MSHTKTMTPDLAPPTALRDKLAQLVFVRIGSNLPPVRRVNEDESRIAGLLSECPIGGLLLFNGPWPEVRDTLARLQQTSRWPLLVASDLERGAGQQLHGLTVFPHARAFAELGEGAAQAVAEAATHTAREALAAGVHALLAPVADVNSNPANPIIATRALAETPELASRLVEAYVHAANAAGVMCCAKHFPGHGDTQGDSHAMLPVVDRPLEALEATELPPFRAAVAAGAPMIMTAHVSYPALDPSGAPATVSRPILQGLLRDRLGFDGIICSDSLLMAGVRDRYATEGEAACAAVIAGVDLLLDVADPSAAVEAMARSVESGSLSEARVNEAFERVWRAKSKYMAPAKRPCPSSDSGDAAGLALRVASGAVRCWPQEHGGPLLCLRDQPVTVCLLKTSQLATDPPEQPLAAALRERLSDVRYFELGPDASDEDYARALASAASTPQRLAAMIVKPSAWHAFGLPKRHADHVHAMIELGDAAVASLGVPTALDQFSNALWRLCTYSDTPVSQQALAEHLRPVEALEALPGC